MNDMIIPALTQIQSADRSVNHLQLNVGYGASLSDISRFENSLSAVQNENTSTKRVEEPSNAEQAVMRPLDFINDEASKIVEYAKSAVSSGNELTPSEIVMLTARTHEFMFHCQLTSNIANRTSDGLQQLFRQQS